MPESTIYYYADSHNCGLITFTLIKLTLGFGFPFPVLKIENKKLNKNVLDAVAEHF